MYDMSYFICNTRQLFPFYLTKKSSCITLCLLLQEVCGMFLHRPSGSFVHTRSSAHVVPTRLAAYRWRKYSAFFKGPSFSYVTFALPSRCSASLLLRLPPMFVCEGACVPFCLFMYVSRSYSKLGWVSTSKPPFPQPLLGSLFLAPFSVLSVVFWCSI